MTDGRCERCQGTGQKMEGDIVVGDCCFCDGTGFDDEAFTDNGDGLDWEHLKSCT